MKTAFIFLVFLNLSNMLNAQLKYIVEDFEGIADGPLNNKNGSGVFTYGNIKASISNKINITNSQNTYLGERCIQIKQEGKMEYGGWGKGLGMNVNLNANQDYLNFYILSKAKDNFIDTIKIEIQEDDNDNNVYEKDRDDSWTYIIKPDEFPSMSKDKSMWQLVSIPLNKFSDNNSGGDGDFNISYKKGKLFCVIFSFPNTSKVSTDYAFDFICFSQGKLPTGTSVINSPLAGLNDFCNLGAWSKEGTPGNFSDIAYGFENNFNSGKRNGTDKKLGIVHFFQPFSLDGGTQQNNYPSVERINKVIENGYVPMITLEDHFAKISSTKKQPNLYSITEGHFDDFFAVWAKQLKQVKGTILLRILHEFNGDWYPWCIANNDKNPALLVAAFKKIHTIFQQQGATNVKFIWCANSTSFPQEKWNFVMDAYPGDEYVDFVALDIYNGAGKGLPVWRSFRKEGIENYFVLTQQIPDKPLFVCETSSRERKESEAKPAQDKAEWIIQMSDALQTDMSQIRLLTWFNEKETFKVNSSPEAKNAYQNYVWKNDYFKTGIEFLSPMLGSK